MHRGRTCTCVIGRNIAHYQVHLLVSPFYLIQVKVLIVYRLAAQCTAQLYSFMTQAGALAKMTTCVGHSLGAHVCGMMSEHLTQKQYKIVGKYS